VVAACNTGDIEEARQKVVSMSKREAEPSQWRRSTACEAGTCAEVKFDGDDVLLRSSLNPDATIRLTAEEWRVFRAGIVAGEFEQ
jgi:hypothetical protein